MSSTDITRSFFPGVVAGRVAVQLVVVVQEAVIVVAPTARWSAPGIGRKPDPVMVTGVEIVLGPLFGETPVMLVVERSVPATKHIWAARPGK
jgi:hypothetical protein